MPLRFEKNTSLRIFSLKILFFGIFNVKTEMTYLSPLIFAN